MRRETAIQARTADFTECAAAMGHDQAETGVVILKQPHSISTTHLLVPVRASEIDLHQEYLCTCFAMMTSDASWLHIQSASESECWRCDTHQTLMASLKHG